MLSEYYYPFDFGGSEWSVFYLAKGLKKRGFNISIMTPNYGSKNIDSQDENINLIRFPFFKKITKSQLTPFWHTNIFWNIWTSYWVLKTSLKIQTDVIHIQGKYFLPAAIFTKLVTNKKVIITLRDYIVLCPLGMCIYENHRKCTFFQYFLNDIPKYLRRYNFNSNPLTKTLLVAAALRARLVSLFLIFLLSFCDKIIVLSNVQKKIYEKSGIKKIHVIPNSMEPIKESNGAKKDQILFAGRLTPGKGVDLLIDALPNVIKHNKNLKINIYGDGFLRQKLQNKAKKLSKNIHLLGRISHEKLLIQLSRSRLTVIPSVWPEPFGRLVVESLFVQTPVVVTEQTGAAEFVKEKKWGTVTEASAESLENGIRFVLKNNEKLVQQITKDKKDIENIFTKQAINLYEKIYRNLIQ